MVKYSLCLVLMRKNISALRALIIVSCIFSLIFVSGFNFSNFTSGSHSYYASEITCSSPSKGLNCSASAEPGQRLFRGNPDESTQIRDYGTRYVSSSFAKFIGVFISSTDNFSLVILKVYLIKALLATYLLFSILIYLKKLKELKNLITQMTLLFFSFPYFLSAITSVYPPGLATVAAMSLLVVLRIFIDQYVISKGLKIFLCLNLLISSLIIVSNRFETTSYILLCFGVFIVFGTSKSKFFERLKIVGTPLFIFATSFTTVWIFSKPFRELFIKVLRRDFVVLVPALYEDSEMIKQFGRSAVAAQAPYTFIDNIVREIYNSALRDFFEEHFDFVGPYGGVILTIGFLVSFFIPGSLIFLNAFIKNLKPFFSYKKFDGSERKSQIAPLLILFSMVLIPFVAFTPWFIWYIMPLLLSYLWFTNAQLSPGKVSKYLYLTVFVTNSLNYFIYSDQLGSIYISSFIVRPILLNTLFALAALTLWFQVPRFVNSYSQNLSTK